MCYINKNEMNLHIYRRYVNEDSVFKEHPQNKTYGYIYAWLLRKDVFKEYCKEWYLSGSYNTLEINGKEYVYVYVGQSTQITYRERQYLKWYKGKKTAIHSFIHKVGKKYNIDDVFPRIIIDYADNQQILDIKEIHWIKRYKLFKDNNRYAFNYEKGGNGGKPSEETCKKISESHKGEKNPLFKGYIKVILKGEIIYIGESTIDIERNARSVKGGKIDRSLISKCLNGKYKTHGGYTYEYCTKEEYESWKENRGKINYDAISNAKSFIKVLLDNKIIYIGQSKTDIERNVRSVKGGKLYNQAISQCLNQNGKQKTCGGYTYEYCTKEEYEGWKENEGEINYDAISNTKPFIKVLLNNEIIYIGENTLDIERNVKSIKDGKLYNTSISRCLKGKQKTCGGYTYEYCSKEEYENWKEFL